MSKIIKSTYAKAENSGSKTISIKKLKFNTLNEEFITEKKESADGSFVGNEDEIKQLLQEAEQQAKFIMEQAESAALEIRKQLEQERQFVNNELDQLKEEAKQQGYDLGYQQGLEAGKQQYTQVIAQVNNLVEASKKEYIKTVEQAQPTIIELAFAISKKIIGNTVKTEDEAWINVVQQAVLEVRDQAEVKVYVHPHWFERTVQHKNELVSLLSHTEQLFIYADSQLKEHDCVIETPFGRIDANIDSQLTELKKVLNIKLKEGKHAST
ncbi:flagellar assembly protein FliH [Alkalihalobacterium elongatum]|uniref:flagellar assembly protein FliH n=1 Tax=Alkalihalobacterium elongatum TaxID=2675466 RepID=UPI001C1F44EC|nr:flagellar assembly protein FliH [Alkalihalobacterium elongatum]